MNFTYDITDELPQFERGQNELARVFKNVHRIKQINLTGV